jgi:hypothetical protein
LVATQLEVASRPIEFGASISEMLVATQSRIGTSVRSRTRAHAGGCDLLLARSIPLRPLEVTLSARLAAVAKVVNGVI